MRTSAIGTEDTDGRSTPRDQPFSHGLGRKRPLRATRQQSDESILENRGVYDKAPAEPTSEDRVTA